MKKAAPSASNRPPRHAALPNGTTVAGRYHVEGVLGEGAHSVVYRARRDPDGASVALKVIHRHLTGDRQVAKRFEREASILRRLEGEHVVRMLDFVEDDGLLVIALELVDGVSLEAMLAEQAPLPIATAIEVSLQVCAALGAAHANGIVHRDLKTANVLVERVAPVSSGASAPALRVKVVDFGLSKVLHGQPNTGLTEQGMIFGTPDYMAPEQARGDEVDERADLYAAGVMLYEMTVGAPPFSGRTPLHTMTAHLREPPPSPREKRPEANITPALEAVILRALAKSPGDRFASARELAQAIASARDEPLVVAPSLVLNPEEIATSDTDLHLAPPSFSHAKTLRADEIAEIAEESGHIPLARINVTSAPSSPPATMPSAKVGASVEAIVKKAPAHQEISDEPTAVSGEPLPTSTRTKLLWAVVAIVAAAVGVVIGILVGAR